MTSAFICAGAFEEFWPSATLFDFLLSIFRHLLALLLSSIHKKIFVGVGSQALEPPLEVHTNCNTGCSTICKVEKLLQIIS